MAWIDNIENIKFSIKTGDSKVYNPFWSPSNKTKDFNTAKYDFIDVKGSFIDRKKPQSGKHSLVFWFQGEDYIEKSNEFDFSADDNRAWVVTHPIYGTLNGQPNSITTNNDSLNATKFTVDFWESINADLPNTEISIKDNVLERTDKVRAKSISSFSSNAMPIAADISVSKDLINFSSSRLVPDSDNSVRYRNAVSKAENSLDDLVSETSSAASNMQDIYNIGSDFTTPVKNKVNNFISAYQDIKRAVLLVDSVYSKVLFETQAADVLSNMALSSVNPISTDYLTRSDVSSIDSLIRSTYDDYLEQMDANQVSIYDIENTYNPDFRVQSDLRELITFNSKSLFTLAFDAKQERTIELKKDSNLILLTHRFLGLDASDENINKFKEINNIGLNEIFQLRKGRLITYYV